MTRACDQAIEKMVQLFERMEMEALEKARREEVAAMPAVMPLPFQCLLPEITY